MAQQKNGNNSVVGRGSHCKPESRMGLRCGGTLTFGADIKSEYQLTFKNYKHLLNTDGIIWVTEGDASMVVVVVVVGY